MRKIELPQLFRRKAFNDDWKDIGNASTTVKLLLRRRVKRTLMAGDIHRVILRVLGSGDGSIDTISETGSVLMILQHVGYSSP